MSLRLNFNLGISSQLFVFFMFLLAPTMFAAALSGTGCTTGGDCVVNTTQTIDSGTTYYFNSLVINPGVTITLAYSSAAAGGSVWFYVANAANISGAIAANGAPGSGSNPNGGGYAGGQGGNNGGTGGGGGGYVSIYAKIINITSNGSISANAGNGNPTQGGTTGGGGGGSGGTIKLYAGSINFNGAISAIGGNGATNGGGGAGGSLVMMPLTIAYLSQGSINLNGGSGSNAGDGGIGANGGGSGRAGGAAGAGSYFWPGGSGGGSGGAGAYNGGAVGAANAARNIKLYNAYVPSGSIFSISSSGASSGLMDAYLTPSSSKYSGLSVTYKPDNMLLASFGPDMSPTVSTNFTIVNSSNQGQAYASLLTGSDGTVTSVIALLPSESYNVLTSAASNNGHVSFAYANTTSPQQSGVFLKTSSIIPKLLLRWLNTVAYSPSNTALSGKGVYATVDGSYACAGSTDSSGSLSCLLVKTAVDGSNAAVDYSINLTVAEYNSPILFDYVQVPNSIYLGGANDTVRLTGFTSTTDMALNSNYYRYIFYPIKTNGESGFAFRETIPSDFSFNSPAVVYMSNGTIVSNCTVALIGQSYVLDSSNCAMLGNQASSGDWVKVAYILNSPTTDAFFTQTKTYDFSTANLSVTSP